MNHLTLNRIHRFGTNRLALATPTLIACIGLNALGCDREEPLAEETIVPTTEEVAESPERYVGKKLTLTGEVDEVFGDQAFELEGNDVIFDDELLVLTKSPLRLRGAMVQDDDMVMVSGTVRRFVVTELERDLGWDLSPELEVEWKNKVVFVADSVSLVGESARWTEGDQSRLVGLVSIYHAPDPKSLVGQSISLRAVPVQGKAGDVLWIGENQQNKVLVAPAQGKQLPDVSVGERVAIEGTVRQMPQLEQAMDRFKLDATAKDEVTKQALFIEASSTEKSESR